MSESLRDIAINHSESLIEKSQKGDNHAFGKLVGLWFKRIYNLSLKYFGDHDLAMEATQTTFINVYDNIKNLKDIKSFKFWLYKIALNQCHEEERKQAVEDLYPKFEHDIKNFVIDYGRTIRSLEDEDKLILKIKLTRCEHCSIPGTIEVAVKMDVLRKFDQQKLSREKALEAIVIKKDSES